MDVLSELALLREFGYTHLDLGGRPVTQSPGLPVENAQLTTGQPGDRATGQPFDELRERALVCTQCRLSATRKNVVFGVGNPNADLMFIGEAPGRDEDEKGEPFVGRAGQLLTDIIKAMKLTRDDVYIANVIKCRPPENRNPDPDEVLSCEPFLFKQIESIGPQVIVALGAFAAKALLKSEQPISRLRGQVHDYHGAKLIPTFHPSFLLRSPDRKRDAWEDLKRARALLSAAVGASD